MRKRLENRQLLDIITGIVMIGLLAGGITAFMTTYRRWTPKAVNNTILVVIIIGLFGSLYWLSGILPGRMRTFSFLKKNNLLDCGEDIDLSSGPAHPESKLYLGAKAIYSGRSKVMVPYEQIAWVYKEQHKTNGVTDRRELCLCTKSGHTASLPLGKAEFEGNSVIISLARYLGPDVIYGYTPKNREAYRSIVKANKQ